MGREIKFRVWDTRIMITKSIHDDYDDYYMLDLQGNFFGHTRTGDEWFEYDKDETNKTPFVLMQFTGLKDAEINGKEVFEGDIIENCDTKLLQIVYWDEQKAAWFCQYNESKRTVSLDNSLGNLNKVIGNIYENSDLLK